MEKLRILAKPLSILLTFCLLHLGVFSTAARAALVDTETAVRSEQGNANRDRVLAALARDDVRQYLSTKGVDPRDVERRVQALTDDEAATMAQRLDELPAGGDVLGVIVFLFLVLLVTDILGFTDVFPFVKKRAR